MGPATPGYYFFPVLHRWQITQVAGTITGAANTQAGNNGTVDNIMGAGANPSVASFANGAGTVAGANGVATLTHPTVVDLATPVTISTTVAATTGGTITYKGRLISWGVLFPSSP